MAVTRTRRTGHSTASTSLDDRAAAFGCPALIHIADRPTSAHLDYLDLLPSRSGSSLLPDAVAEFQGRPVMYLVDGSDEDSIPRQDDSIRNLQQLLANRSEQACLGIVRPGSLEVYPINLDRRQLAKSVPRIVTQSAPDAPTFFQGLASGVVQLKGQPKAADFVFKEVHNLLSRASDDLAGKMKPLDVLSVTGRALFFRFLLDRRIVRESELEEICPRAEELKDVFSDVEKAAATSCWLDETFNGDLLPLLPEISADTDAHRRQAAYVEFYRKTDKAVFLHLQAILRGWESLKGSEFQRRLTVDWNDLDFAHIPIGVLSQVYETFSRQWDEDYAETTSVYYTPKNIARCIVDEAFGGMDDPAEARVLDASCGAGIFLVLAFRKLVRARWEKDERRPDTRTIQRILYNQICGFDVSEPALRLAALALYITAIELNGSPRPPKSLKFPRPLNGHALFNFGRHDADIGKGFVLGSLGSDVPERFNRAFEVVLGNPPWTRLRVTGKEGDEDKAVEKARLAAVNCEFTKIIRRTLEARGLTEIAATYTNPDGNPDLPFVWRATEWAKPNGIIAMALPGRILFKQSDKGRKARTALLRGLAVTGIINGSNLPETAVWPKMKQPFMLFFARNAVPPQDHAFYFATPVRERRLNDRGLFRIDYQAAEAVATRAAIDRPWLLKTLALGTSLDVEVTDGLLSLGWLPIRDFWVEPELYSGRGYDLSPNLEPRSADHLFSLLDFEEPDAGFAIDYQSLQTWKDKHQRDTAHRPREEQLYKRPLLVVPQTPGESRKRPKSFRSTETSLCFSQSHYGFSAADHPDSGILVSLLYLITHSLLFQYFCLMSSSRLGVERRTFIKVDLESFPFPDVNKLTAVQKRRITALARALETRTKKLWNDIDSFIFGLYGLDEDDATVVRDTLAVGAPYQSVRGPAEQPPELCEADTFRCYLQDMLQPSFEVVGQRVAVELLPPADGEWDPAWRFLTIAVEGDTLPVTSELIIRLMDEANRTAASRVVMHMPEGGLLLGVLNQRRFWTRSRARLCGVYVLRHHLEAFPLEMTT